MRLHGLPCVGTHGPGPQVRVPQNPIISIFFSIWDPTHHCHQPSRHPVVASLSYLYFATTSHLPSIVVDRCLQGEFCFQHLSFKSINISLYPTTRNCGSPDASNHQDINQTVSENDLLIHKDLLRDRSGEMHRERISWRKHEATSRVRVLSTQ